jgi:hypothetical protein
MMTKKFNKRKIYHICRLDKFVNFLDNFLETKNLHIHDEPEKKIWHTNEVEKMGKIKKSSKKICLSKFQN